MCIVFTALYENCAFDLDKVVVRNPAPKATDGSDKFVPAPIRHHRAMPPLPAEPEFGPLDKVVASPLYQWLHFAGVACFLTGALSSFACCGKTLEISLCH